MTFLKENKIKAETIKGMGAASSARLGYFNQKTKEYEEKQFGEAMEIVSLVGNISLKNNGSFPLLHSLFFQKKISPP